MMRDRAAAELGPQLRFNEATTEAGRDALGLMAVCYEAPGRAASFNRVIQYREQGWV
jgi:phage terminase large subunit